MVRYNVVQVSRILGFAAVAALVVGALAQDPAKAPKPAPVPKAIRTALKKKCESCHGVKNPAEGFNITALVAKGDFKGDVKEWNHIVRKVEKNRMPPQGSEPLTEVEHKALLAWIKAGVEKASK